MSDGVDIVGQITSVETIATGNSVRVRGRLDKAYGRGNWRKCKGTARVRLADDTVRWAEIHWYEAHGHGRVDFKIKRLLSYE